MSTPNISITNGSSNNNKFINSLRGKLVLLFLSVGLLPLTVIGVLGYWQAANKLEAQAGNTLKDLAFNGSDKLDRNLFERYGDVQAYAKSEQARSMDAVRISSWMNQMMTTYTPIYNLMIVAGLDGKIVAVNTVDLNGQPIASQSLIGLDVSNQEWFKVAVNGQLAEGTSFVEDLHEDTLVSRIYGSGQRGYAMNFTYPIRDQQNKIVGVWSNRFNWQVMIGLMGDVLKRATADGSKTEKLYIIKKDGLVLYNSDNAADSLTLNLATNEIVKLALDKKASDYKLESKSFDNSNTDRMYGYFHSTGFSTYPGLDWAVIAAQDRSEALSDVYAVGRTSVIIGLISIFFIAFLAYFIASSITRPILAVVHRLRKLAAGGADLTSRLPVASHDEVGELAIAFNTFMESLTDIVRSLIDTSTKLSSGATEIAAASNQMSAGAESQTQQVIRTSSAMEEISATIKEVARTAQSTANATAAAVERAKQGSSRLQSALTELDQTNTSLQHLHKRSAEIDQVVKLIADIAAQTNILALNAAIEAAGAGAAGARFDVVAEEIRKLAGRTAESTARIRDTVAEIQQEMQGAADRMGKTVNQAEDVEQSLNDIVECIASVNDMVSMISSSTNQQARAAEQVADALQLITQVSQQTALATRETTVTIDDLSSLSRNMNATANRFKIG